MCTGMIVAITLWTRGKCTNRWKSHKRRTRIGECVLDGSPVQHMCMLRSARTVSSDDGTSWKQVGDVLPLSESFTALGPHSLFQLLRSLRYSRRFVLPLTSVRLRPIASSNLTWSLVAIGISFTGRGKAAVAWGWPPSPSSVEDKHEWKYTSTPLFAFMTCCLRKHCDVYVSQDFADA
jgi:hypothetical protein